MRPGIACDLHQHTALTPTRALGRDHVASNVVEGVECAVASEHNLVGDRARCARSASSASVHAGERSRATRAASVRSRQRVPMRPVRRGRGRDRGAGPPREGRHRRSPCPASASSINQRSGRNGYFDQLRFDAATGRGAAAGYDDRFDAVEVWSGRYVSGRARVLEDLWGLLRASRPVTPTASTDTHGIVQAEPGYPRTYVAVGTDDPAALDPAALVDAIRRKRDAVLTNGPFVTMRAGEVGPGGLIKAGEARRLALRIALTVRVERAPWVDATDLRIWVGGVAGEAIPLTGARITPAGALFDEVTIPLTIGRRGGNPPAAKGSPAPIRIAEDTFVVAIVQGQRPLEPVFPGARMILVCDGHRSGSTLTATAARSAADPRGASRASRTACA
jgi:hypothetical protein